jgi:phage-related protein
VPERVRRRWRDYRTPSGRRPVREFLTSLSDVDAAAIIAAMKEVAVGGLEAARHVRGDIYEVRADGDRVIYRLLFATEARRGQILLALEAFGKTTQKTPPSSIAVAERRLRDWRALAR